MRTILFAFLLMLTAGYTQAQQAPDFVRGEVLVRLPDGKGISAVLQDLQVIDGKASRLQVIKQISKHLNIWRLQFDHQSIAQQTMLEQLWAHPLVRVAQNNHLIKLRNTTPNDPLYAQQWQYDNTGANGGTIDADVDAPEAWDITTGGVTPLGDTIVVCVVDDGLDMNHADFAGNIWYNYADIPNNGVDDDNNGYIDDRKGWNTDSSDDDISGGNFGGGHGTSVAGIVGARGNNGIGVTGVNWYVKLMIVVGGGNEAQAIEAYEYPLAQRRRYNQTGGAEGAFVVATNSSWGVDGLQYTNAPLWCAFYDTLGAYGILNAGATTNNQSNVDVVGDMPTSCPSDYMVAVTNMTRTGAKNNPAGYGATTVDLGAFGTSTYTAADGNTYGGFGGTSGATPHVAGTIALLYSAPCPRLTAVAKSDPAAAALAVRGIILGTVVPHASLAGITTTGGTLNIKNAMDSLLNWGCNLSGCHEPFGIATTSLSGTQAGLNWWGVSAASAYMLRYREQGSSTWTNTTTTDTFLTISGLVACTFYEVEVAADCDTAQTAYSNTFRFKTGDCCLAPNAIVVGTVTDTTADFSWNSDANVNDYTVEFRAVGMPTWGSYTASGASVNLQGLLPCTNYELRIISACDINVNNEYSTIITFKTKGCGACEDISYCGLAAGDASYEWIANVSLNGLNNNSLSDNGYGDYTGGTVPDLEADSSYYLSLTVDRASPSTVNWRVWVDFDQNGSFDTDEKALEILGFSGNTTGDTIAIPADAVAGITRMRVAMRYNNAPTECGTYNYGEVEDYCVRINSTLSGIGINATNQWQSLVYPNPFQTAFNVDIQANQPTTAFLRLDNVAGQSLWQQNTALFLGTNTLVVQPQELPSGVYFLHIQLGNGQSRVHKIVK